MTRIHHPNCCVSSFWSLKHPSLFGELTTLVCKVPLTFEVIEPIFFHYRLSSAETHSLAPHLVEFLLRICGNRSVTTGILAQLFRNPIPFMVTSVFTSNTSTAVRLCLPCLLTPVQRQALQSCKGSLKRIILDKFLVKYPLVLPKGHTQ